MFQRLLLGRLIKRPDPIDLVFLDPPYDAEAEYTQTLGFLGGRSAANLLTAGSQVIAEHATRSPFTLPERIGSLPRMRTYKQGDTMLSFYARTLAESQAEASRLPSSS